MNAIDTDITKMRSAAEKLEPARARPRLAVISTFDDMCGIAGYTRSLHRQLSSDFQLELFDLDQFFMRSLDPHVRRLADGMIRDIARRLADFECVNIQLEYGIFGPRNADILRRLKILIDAAPALSITFHTVLPHRSVDFGEIWKNFSRFSFRKGLNHYFGVKKSQRFNRGLFSLLRRAAKQKTLSVIVHTRRDMRIMRFIHRLPHVYDHPLSFLSASDARLVRQETTRASIPVLNRAPPNAKIIGVFGFLSEYKGFETVIRALQLLPEEYHVALFGGVHPQEIKPNVKIYPYVRSLLDEAYVGATVFDGLPANAVSVNISADDAMALVNHPKDIGARVHFLGAQSDEEFVRGMAVCDLVVLPYVEVGQSSSGPLSMAVEMGCRVLAARNLAFLQFDRYHPGRVEFFEIGNFLELADKIQSEPTRTASAREPKFNLETNKRIYISANSVGQGVTATASSGI